MSSNHQTDLDKIREEHLKQIFQLYQDKAKGFQKTFNILCFLALAFLFIILIPYVSIKATGFEIEGRLHELSSGIAQLEPRIKAYERAIRGYEEVRKELKNGPYRLRDFILSLPQHTEETSQSAQTGQIEPGPCKAFVGEEMWHCRISQEVERLFAELQNSLRQNFMGPLQVLDAETAASIDLAALEKGLEALQATFEEKLALAPTDFWRTFTGKGEFFGEFTDEVDRFWRESGSVIDEQNRKLEKDRTILQGEKVALEQQKTQLQGEELQIAERLRQIEFPLGRLPIGLNESVAVFPMLLAVGFAISASGLLETLRLRRAFQTLYQQKDPTKNILTDELVALIAPLWIDPLSPAQNRIVRFSILFVPFVVFLVASGLVFYSWTIFDPATGANVLNYWMYGGLYVLSLAVFIYCYWQLVMQLRHYEPA